MIIGHHASATLMIARTGKHPFREFEQAVKRLNQAGGEVQGFSYRYVDRASAHFLPSTIPWPSPAACWPVRRRRASYRQTPVATETLRLATDPSIGIFTS